MRLPKTKIMEFDGNCLKYWTFLNSFDSCIHHSTVTDADKLNCQMEYSKGKPAKVIEACVMMTSSERYRQVRDLLKRRFGKPHAIYQTWISKIINVPPVKPNNEEVLLEFANDVRGCLKRSEPWTS